MHVQRINMVYMCIVVAAVPLYNICFVLQIDQCGYFINVFFTIFIYYKTEMPDNRHIFDVIYMHLAHDAALPWYNISIVLQIDQCRYLITVLTIFIRYKIEIQVNRHIVDAIYMHLFKFISIS